MLSYIDHYTLFPAEKKIANHRSDDDGQAEPRVVGHENQH